MTLASDPVVALARERFERDTAEHELAVLRDDGLYRHLRFQTPETWVYGYDLVTWPGYLTIVGDVGNFVFSRVRDMFEFFEQRGGVSPGYWAEKLQAPCPDAARVYSYDRYRERVLKWLRDVCDGLPAGEEMSLRAAANERLLDGWLGAALSEHEAHRLLFEFEHEGHRPPYDPSDPWDLREFDGRFLWCCWAIVRGIERYRALDASRSAA